MARHRCSSNRRWVDKAKPQDPILRLRLLYARDVLSINESSRKSVISYGWLEDDLSSEL